MKYAGKMQKPVQQHIRTLLVSSSSNKIFFFPRIAEACVRFKNVPHYFRFLFFSKANLFEIINNYRKMFSKLQSQKVVWGFAGWWCRRTMKSRLLFYEAFYECTQLPTYCYNDPHPVDCWCFCHTYLWRPNYSSGLRVFQLQRFLNHSIFFHLMQHKHKSIWCIMLYIMTARLWTVGVLSGLSQRVYMMCCREAFGYLHQFPLVQWVGSCSVSMCQHTAIDDSQEAGPTGGRETHKERCGQKSEKVLTACTEPQRRKSRVFSSRSSQTGQMLAK